MSAKNKRIINQKADKMDLSLSGYTPLKVSSTNTRATLSYRFIMRYVPLRDTNTFVSQYGLANSILKNSFQDPFLDKHIFLAMRVVNIRAWTDTNLSLPCSRRAYSDISGPCLNEVRYHNYGCEANHLICTEPLTNSSIGSWFYLGQCGRQSHLDGFHVNLPLGSLLEIGVDLIVNQRVTPKSVCRYNKLKARQPSVHDLFIDSNGTDYKPLILDGSILNNLSYCSLRQHPLTRSCVRRMLKEKF